jgi:hypothetical protein
MPRLILVDADHCPFCGCEKIFLKARTQGSGEKRFAISCQCSRCHVHGPQVFSEWMWGTLGSIGEFSDLPNRNELIDLAIAKWNERH